MCKISRITIRFKCHNAIYKKTVECLNAGHACRKEYREETIVELRKLCRRCEEEKAELKLATVEADKRIRRRAMKIINERAKDNGKGKGKATNENSNAYSKNSGVLDREPVPYSEHDTQTASYDSYYEPDEAPRHYQGNSPLPVEDWMLREADGTSGPCVGPTNTPYRKVEKWMSKVANPSTRDSAQSSEKNRDLADFYLDGLEDTDDEAYCEAWSSGEENLVATRVIREERREMRRREKTSGRGEGKGKGKEQAR